jgi:hypothetical protein
MRTLRGVRLRFGWEYLCCIGILCDKSQEHHIPELGLNMLMKY